MEIIRSIEEIEREVEANDIVLLYFGMDSCVVCVDLLPKVEELLEKYPKIKSFQVKAEQDISLAAEYSVFTAPVIIIYIDGKEGIREARLISIPDLDRKISRYYEMLFAE